MKILSLKFGGIGRFREDVEVPIEGLGTYPLVAVVGGNGAGKSTMLELVPGATFRTTPSRGAVAALANRRDSFIEMGVELAGERYTLKLLMDGVARATKTEAYVFDAEGNPLSSGKAKDFDAEIARRFPSKEVFFSSAFAAQGGEGRFLELPASKRKALFADLLGLGHLQAMSDRAGEHVREIETKLSAARTRIETLGDQASKAGEWRAQLEEAEREVERAEIEGKEARIEHERYQKAVDEWRQDLDKALRAVDVAQSEKREIDGELTRIDAALDSLTKKMSESAGTMSALRGRLEKRGDYEEADKLARDAESRIPALEEQIEEARQSTADRSEWETKAAELRRAVQDAEREERDAVNALERAEQDASALSGVPCGGEGEFGSCSLIQIATKARSGLASLRAGVEEATDRLGRVRVECAEFLASPPAQPDTDARAIEEDLRGLRATVSKAADARAKLAGLAEVADRLDAMESEAESLRREKETTRDGRVEISAKFNRAAGAVDEARTKAAGLRDSEPKRPDVDLEELRRRWGECTSRVSSLQVRLEEAEKAAGLVADAEAEVAEHVDELDQWRHLQKALGRDGVQALEIDAAGPEVSDLTNELLHACYGTRFAVSLETTRLKADGKGTKEVFEIRVIDSERGVECSADQLSGGEQVLVSEALALAIAIYNARRSQVPLEDLFRDECAGALSSENAVRYIEMLRKAIDLGGFHRCYFVAHQPELWDLADERLLVEDGTVCLADAADVVLREDESEAAA